MNLFSPMFCSILLALALIPPVRGQTHPTTLPVYVNANAGVHFQMGVSFSGDSAAREKIVVEATLRNVGSTNAWYRQFRRGEIEGFEVWVYGPDGKLLESTSGAHATPLSFVLKALKPDQELKQTYSLLDHFRFGAPGQYYLSLRWKLIDDDANAASPGLQLDGIQFNYAVSPAAQPVVPQTKASTQPAGRI